jgi:hypothetical protein
MQLLDAVAVLFAKAQGFITAVGLIVTLFFSWRQQRRLVRVEQQQTYQRLELASNEVFRFTATHAETLVAYQALQPDPSIDFDRAVTQNAVADNHIFQTLNLFEMAARLRREEFFEDEIFASWVIWYYELLQSWYFRYKWPDMALNYTREMRLVFDEPVRKFDLHADEGKRVQAFYTHVARVLDCPAVLKALA